MVKKTLWPYGILIIIAIGILLLIGLVYASLKQPNLDEEAFMQSYEEVEKNINEYIKDTHLFLQNYDVLFSVNKHSIPLISPYLQKKQNKKVKIPTLKLGANNIFKLDFIPSKNSSQNPEIVLKKYKIYAMHYYHQDKKNSVPFFISNHLKETFTLNPNQQGRLKLILEIIFSYKNQDKKIFLQHDLFVEN